MSSLAITRLHPDMRCCIDELHLLLPIHRPDTRLSPRRDALAHSTTLFPGLHLLGREFMALWALRRALLPHCCRVRHLRGRSNHFHVNVPDWTSLLRHVPTSYGIFLCFPAYLALGFCNGCAAESEKGCYTCPGDGCVECDEHRHCLPISRVERTVSLFPRSR